MSDPTLLTQVKFSEYPDHLLDIQWDIDPERGHRYLGVVYWFDIYWCNIHSWSIFDLLQKTRRVMDEMELG